MFALALTLAFVLAVASFVFVAIESEKDYRRSTR